MEKAFETISLIPYIESADGGFRLEIALADARTLEESAFPFQLVQAPRPLSRLVRAAVRTDRGATMKRLFLLIQHHGTVPPSDGLTQVTNTTIDALWQQTRIAYSDAPEKGHCFIPFPDKGEEEARPPYFKPLFFCKERHIYFHPPCPECGNELTLCRGDEQLKRAGLAMFSTSMERHLYCPGCVAAKGSSTFYKWSRQPGDAVFVKDRTDLVLDFKLLRSPGHPQCGFPCTTCSNHSECYILDRKAKERIAFFSFYPFYMLMFEACALNAVDFLALASGAPEDEVNQVLHQGGKGISLPVPCRFFFENDARLFLEILFVKLSFLRQVLDLLATRADRAVRPGSGFTAQSFWIEPMKETTPLPWLWNFRVAMIDLLETAHGHSGSREFSIPAFFRFFSSLWFYTLAVNKTRTFESVLRKIDTPTAAMEGETPLAMDDIFWDPDRFEAPREYHRFWADAVQLGLDMKTIMGNASLGRETALLADRIKTLEQGIKDTLFAPTQGRPMAPPETKAAPGTVKNPALARMLTAILQKWEAESTGTTEPADAIETLEEMEDDDVLETVVLSAPKEESDLDKTVVITPDSPPSREEGLEKTMIMAVPKTPSPPERGPTIKEEKGFDDLEETVILTPGKQQKEKKP
ncbi:MAG: hypothetical protein GY737_19350 [Desulfobacteraceae bacterium]|nr:hypothetical protein [Desulfobacteraceae bacterium]